MKILGLTVVRSTDWEKWQQEAGNHHTMWLQSKDRIDVLQKLNAQQADTIRGLRLKVDGDKLKGLIEVDIGDPTPTDGENRKSYVMRVAGFYKDILKQKCLQQISVYHKLLEEETNDRESDNILKIGIFVCREWTRWGEQAVNEAVGYITEPPATTAEQKETLETNTQL